MPINSELSFARSSKARLREPAHSAQSPVESLSVSVALEQPISFSSQMLHPLVNFSNIQWVQPGEAFLVSKGASDESSAFVYDSHCGNELTKYGHRNQRYLNLRSIAAPLHRPL